MAAVHRALRGLVLVKWPTIREVKDPVSPAVAFTENGRTVVEVDENLKGKARAAAIWAAVRLHERGRAALVTLPILAFVWDPLKRWSRQHIRATRATAAAAKGALVVAASIITVIVLLNSAEQPKIADPPITVTAIPTRPSQSPHIIRKPTPSATPTQGIPEPAHSPEPTARAVTWPTVRPTTSTRSTPTRSTRPRPTATAKPPQTDAPEAPIPTPERVSADPTTPPTAATTPPADESVEPPAPAGDDCLLRVDLDPLLDVCALS